jgi:hypothetical protein
VFTIERVPDVPAELLVSQRVAKLLTQLDRGNAKAWKSGFEFAKETPVGYSGFKDMQRLRELEQKSERTAAENERLEGLRKKLQPYLPS